MDSIILEKTKSTPFVRLDPENRKVEFKGESFPENAAKFFAPLFSWMRDYLATEFQELTVEIEMTYFNSSTSKAFMNMLEMFEKAVLSGKNVVVNWRCREDNETILEAGEEFKEDAPSLTFNIVTYKAE
jgi:hypothetical protein